MARLDLSMETLGEVDRGAAQAIVDAEISKAIEDIDDRGSDEKPREVNIKLVMQQRPDGLVETHVACQAKVPPRRTNPTLAELNRKGGHSNLVFSSHAPDNPNQKTLPVMDREDEDDG